MANRDLRVTIDAKAAKFEAGIQRATRATMRMETQLRSADLAAADLDRQLAAGAAQAAQQRADDMQKLGRGLVVFGAATLVGLGMAAKAAIDWESAWAGVRKTVEGSPEQLAQLEGELRNLATTLPATHAEIAGVAEAAGQLGIATEDVSAFTKVMIDLGETTNLTAEEAATSIAKLMNIMQTAPGDVDNLGAALVDLGNNGASTERDIIEMALRIAGAGEQIGLTESDVLGFANALASLGIEAEAGGSAISRVMSDMAKAVAQGGDELNAFAEVAGMTASEFAAAFREDPAAAIASFVEGLGGIKAAGGDVFTVLDNMGLGSIRVRDALLRLAGGGDILRESLQLGADAWEENTALVEEAEKRYDTTEAKIQIARNTLVDLAIDIGGVLLPALSGMAEGVANVLRWFSDLPGPVKTVATVLATIAGAASLAGGGFLLLAPRLRAAQDLMLRMARTNPVLAGGLMTVGGALAKVSIAAAAVGVAVPLLNAAATAIENIGRSGEASIDGVGFAMKAIQDLSQGGSKNIDELVDHVHGLNDGWNQTGARMLGLSDTLGDTEGDFQNLSNALAEMVAQGERAAAEEIFGQLRERLIGAGADAEDVDRAFSSFRDALARAESQAPATGEAIDEVAGALGAVDPAAEEAAKAVEDMVKTMSESLASAVDPVAAWETAQQRVAESAAEAAGEGKEAWQDFADDVKVSFSDYLAELEKQVEAQANWATNIGIIASQVGPDIANEIMGWGPEAAPLVQEFVESIGTEEFGKLEPLIRASMASEQTAIAEEMRKWFEVAGPIADQFGQETANQIAAGIATGQTTVEEALGLLNLQIEENTPGEVTVTVGLDSTGFYAQFPSVTEDIAALNAGRPLPQIGLDTKQYFDGSLSASQDMKVLAGERPTPNADMNLDDFLAERRRANGFLSDLHGERPTPQANLNIDKVRTGKTQAQTTINSLRGKTVKAGADVFGKRAVDGLKSSISSLRNRTVTVTTNHKVIGPGFSGSLASGGPVEMGKMYEVGEQGRELFVPHADGQIIPHGRTESILSGLRSMQGGASATSVAASVPVTAAGHLSLAPEDRALLRKAAESMSGVSVGTLSVQAWSDRFSLRQIEDELSLHGVS